MSATLHYRDDKGRRRRVRMHWLGRFRCNHCGRYVPAITVSGNPSDDPWGDCSRCGRGHVTLEAK